eukprot:scaffold58698_cov70-Phaeocystis_antarctica.AAC.2
MRSAPPPRAAPTRGHPACRRVAACAPPRSLPRALAFRRGLGGRALSGLIPNRSLVSHARIMARTWNVLERPNPAVHVPVPKAECPKIDGPVDDGIQHLSEVNVVYGVRVLRFGAGVIQPALGKREDRPFFVVVGLLHAVRSLVLQDEVTVERLAPAIEVTGRLSERAGRLIRIFI